MALKASLSVGSAELQSSLGKFVQLERRTGDPSAVAGASILASLSSLRQDLSRLRPSDLKAGKSLQGEELPAHPVVQDGLEDEIDDLEINSAPNAVGNDKATDSEATSKNDLPLGCNPECSGKEAGNVKLSEMNDMFGPFLERLGQTISNNLDLNKSIIKQVLEERNEWTRDSLPTLTSGLSLRCAVFRDDIIAGIQDGSDLQVSFDDFPYYLRYLYLKIY